MFRDGDKEAAKAAQAFASGGATEPRIDEADSLTLAMLYANGEGVERNIEFASELACMPTHGWADSNDVFRELASHERFEVCGQDGSQFGRTLDYLCAAIRLDQVAVQIKKQEEATSAAVPASARPALNSLVTDWAKLRQAHEDADQAGCGGGNGCPTAGLKDDLAFGRHWLTLLKDIASGISPAAGSSATDLPAVDKELNRQYQGAVEDFI
jgi:hypothetical protein